MPSSQHTSHTSVHGWYRFVNDVLINIVIWHHISTNSIILPSHGTHYIYTIYISKGSTKHPTRNIHYIYIYITPIQLHSYTLSTFYISIHYRSYHKKNVESQKAFTVHNKVMKLKSLIHNSWNYYNFPPDNNHNYGEAQLDMTW